MPTIAEHFSLIKATVTRAIAGSTFYSETIGHLSLSSMTDFADFPILTRKDVVENLDSIRVSGVPIHYVNTTSGTSFAPELDELPLIQFRSESERDAHKFLMESGINSNSDQSTLILRVVTGEHGQDMAGGVSGLITIPLQREQHAHAVLKLLGMSFNWGGVERKIRVITGSCYALKCLTVAILKLRHKYNDFDIDYVVSSGGHLTTHWKRIFHRIWRAPVLNVYGLSEVAGFNCIICPRCGNFLPSKTAFTEFLEIDSNDQAHDGLVRIVTTSFYPLSEVLPLIRYDTGDIAYLDPKRADECESCFIFIGRCQELDFFSVHSGVRCVVSPLVINDILDSLPETVKSQEEPLASQLGVRPDLGSPRFLIKRSAADNHEIVIHILAEIRGISQNYTYQIYARDWSKLNNKLITSIFPPQERKSIHVEMKPVKPGVLGNIRIID